MDAALARAPQVRSDLHRLDLGTAREIVGTFIGSAVMLAEAARDTPPVTDDRPIQEYGVASLLHAGDTVPASLVQRQPDYRLVPALLRGRQAAG